MGVDVTGVAGTSVGRVGVYGQSRELTDQMLPFIVDRAGVYGAAEVEWGIVGWSDEYKGVGGYTITGIGVEGMSSGGHGVRGGSGSFPAFSDLR
jgi:hypothetical protein